METLEFPHEIKVYISAVRNEFCAAEKALETEGVINVHVKKMFDEDDYGYYLSDVWNKQETFIWLEHDIIPWPGAVRELRECKEPWCFYPYSYDGGCCYKSGLGFIKVSKEILIRRKQWPEVFEWRKQHWSTLVDNVIERLFEYEYHCEHYPPVAHLKGRHNA